MRQTTVQESRAIRFGSGKFEVGETEQTLVNLGAMRDIQFEELWERVRVMSDNAGTVNVGIREHRAALQGNLMEINLENLNLIRGGLDEYSTTAGTETTEDQVILQGSWSFETFIELDGQNADGSAPTINSVTGSENGALADEDDYNLAKNAAGKWGIVLHESGTSLTTEDQNVTINSTYTPAASKVLESGGKISIEPRVVKITNTNEEGKEFSITVFKAEVENGISIELPSDDEEDPAMTEIRLEGEVDQSRDPGKQLFRISDQQTV